MTDDLHARLTAEIDRRFAITRGAKSSPTPWVHAPGHMAKPEVADLFGAVLDTAAGFVANGLNDDMAHIALHDPADAHRRYTHYLRILDRHRPLTRGVCAWFHPKAGDHWPCSEIRDLADALNIPHTQET